MLRPGPKVQRKKERRNIGIHTCPGGDCDSTHSADVDYADLLPSLFELRATNFYIALAGEKDRVNVLEIIRAHLKPEELRNRVYLDAPANQLCVNGLMTDADNFANSTGAMDTAQPELEYSIGRLDQPHSPGDGCRHSRQSCHQAAALGRQGLCRQEPVRAQDRLSHGPFHALDGHPRLGGRALVRLGLPLRPEPAHRQSRPSLRRLDAARALRLLSGIPRHCLRRQSGAGAANRRLDELQLDLAQARSRFQNRYAPANDLRPDPIAFNHTDPICHAENLLIKNPSGLPD